MSAPSHSERVNAVLACLRGETTYEAIAEQFKVTASEVQGWEASFIAGGSSALNESDRDLVTEMGAINAISQSLVALLDLDELWDATVDNLFWVFGYTSTVALIEAEQIVVKSAYSTEGKRLIGYHSIFARNAEN